MPQRRLWIGLSVVTLCSAALAEQDWLQIHPKLRLTSLQPVVVGTSFEATLHVQEECKSLALELFDIDMPEHKHGMMTKPKWECRQSEKQCSIQGLKLHMPGHWRVRARVVCNNRRIQTEHRFEAKL